MRRQFWKIFRRKGTREPRLLRIDGVKTTMTPEPDDAELAAQALLETMRSEECRVKAVSKREQNGTRTSSAEREQARPQGKSEESATAKGNHTVQSAKLKAQSETRDVEYYRRLSEKIRASRAAEVRLTMRYLTYCEEQLALPKELYVGQIGEMESELYKRQTVAEREGGELLRRWQHCLAECIVRQMSAASED